MNKEDKELLLKDLSARLPYGIMCKGITKKYNGDNDEYIDVEVTNVLIEVHKYKCVYGLVGLMNECSIETIKPYLRPLSSMTEKEREEYHELCDSYYGTYFDSVDSIDWLNAHHFDYRKSYDLDRKEWLSMIERGLAIEVTKENNPYK